MLSDLAVAMLQEEHAEKDAIGVVLDVATKQWGGGASVGLFASLWAPVVR